LGTPTISEIDSAEFGIWFYYTVNTFDFDLEDDPFGTSKFSFKSIDCIVEPDSKLGGIYLGDRWGAQDVNMMLACNIRSVLTVAAGVNVEYSKDIIENHMIIEADDMEEFNMRLYFDDSFEFIDEGRKLGSVYVHCYAGVSRSATIMTAYVMNRFNMTFKDAYKLVKSKRYVIAPNPGFVEQLKQFEVELQETALMKSG